MKTETAFWDTSALFPLCCNQLVTGAARHTKRQFPRIVAWWGTSVEIHSSIARLLREAAIDDKQKLFTRRRWNSLIDGIDIIAPTTKLLDIAIDLPEAHAVRSLDAFQLAAALVWCREKPRNRPFISADVKLADAANNAGFDAIVLS
ncbi:MAG: type II toxin-antitoxin system VapC family toxin [Pyrinomonadaceae bacterium]